MNLTTFRFSLPTGLFEVHTVNGLRLEWPTPKGSSPKSSASIKWRLTLQENVYQTKGGHASTLTVQSEDCRVCVLPTAADTNELRLEYDIVCTNGRKLNITFTVRIRCVGQGYTVSGQVNNREASISVRKVVFPILCDLTSDCGCALLWPDGLGQRYANCMSPGFRQTLAYPGGRGTMPWCVLANDECGLYIGRHDPEMQWVTFDASANEVTGGMELSLTHQPFCGPESLWTSPPVVLAPYTGSWHIAASMYRQWYDSVVRIAPIPDWVQTSSGWLLAVLKQQNGDVMWDYRSGIDRLCELAIERGLDTLGLFGWAHGGHDYLYPDYIPDLLMGGRRALGEALARARGLGIRTILYANGIIMDSSTAFYRYQGNDAVLLKEDSEPVVSSIRKFHSSTPVTFAQACLGSPTWRERMFDLAQQAHDLGADGILYDQVGVYGPALCYASDHDHASPATAYTDSRRDLMRDIARRMREINPDFAVMTEGIHDSLLDSIVYVHGWGNGYSAPPRLTSAASDNTLFPELFRFTFPEIPMTNRHATPMMDRYHANYAFVHGLRFEIESRYPADVDYLIDGRIPQTENYADCAYYPPDVDLMRGTAPDIATAYLRKLIDMRRRHADLLLRGRFVDRLGFTLDGAGLTAKAYEFGDHVAVCVWNRLGSPQTCRLNIEHSMAMSCEEAEAGAVSPDSAIPANSVRLYVAQRKSPGERPRP